MLSRRIEKISKNTGGIKKISVQTCVKSSDKGRDKPDT